jgi:unsaturated rhamnogalacturonyl hydrolase
MKKTLLLGASLLCSVFIMATEIPFQKAEIKSIMRKVADWQIANPHPALEHDDLNWPQGALYVGMVDWAELAEKEDNDDTYYKWLTRMMELKDHAEQVTILCTFWIYTASTKTKQ